jgi:hypothetical protein
LNRRTLGLILGIMGASAALVATWFLFRPAINVWGQQCGSVLAPKELVPLSELTRVLEQAAFESACPEAWAPLISWGTVLGVAASILIAAGAYLYLALPKTSSKRRPALPTVQLSSELERIQKLYQAGALTQEEYVSAKSKLLAE